MVRSASVVNCGASGTLQKMLAGIQDYHAEVQTAVSVIVAVMLETSTATDPD
jgi:hypothetical protein